MAFEGCRMAMIAAMRRCIVQEHSGECQVSRSGIVSCYPCGGLGRAGGVSPGFSLGDGIMMSDQGAFVSMVAGQALRGVPLLADAGGDVPVQDWGDCKEGGAVGGG